MSTIVSGYIDKDGSILSGSGFRVSRVSTGRYTVNFESAFPRTPACVVTQVFPQDFTNNGKSSTMPSSPTLKTASFSMPLAVVLVLTQTEPFHSLPSSEMHEARLSWNRTFARFCHLHDCVLRLSPLCLSWWNRKPCIYNVLKKRNTRCSKS